MAGYGASQKEDEKYTEYHGAGTTDYGETDLGGETPEERSRREEMRRLENSRMVADAGQAQQAAVQQRGTMQPLISRAYSQPTRRQTDRDEQASRRYGRVLGSSNIA
jgi:hypothetical protein